MTDKPEKKESRPYERKPGEPPRAMAGGGGQDVGPRQGQTGQQGMRPADKGGTLTGGPQHPQQRREVEQRDVTPKGERNDDPGETGIGGREEEDEERFQKRGVGETAD